MKRLLMLLDLPYFLRPLSPMVLMSLMDIGSTKNIFLTSQNKKP